MNWFERHLNWTWAIMVTIVVLLFSHYILLGLWGWIQVTIDNPIIVTRGIGAARWFLGTVFLIMGSRYIIKQKEHKSWWAALCLLPLGFILPWVLKNNKVVTQNTTSKPMIQEIIHIPDIVEEANVNPLKIGNSNQ